MCLTQSRSLFRAQKRRREFDFSVTNQWLANSWQIATNLNGGNMPDFNFKYQSKISFGKKYLENFQTIAIFTEWTFFSRNFNRFYKYVAKSGAWNFPLPKVGNTEFESLLIFYNYYKSTINLE